MPSPPKPSSPPGHVYAKSKQSLQQLANSKQSPKQLAKSKRSLQHLYRAYQNIVRRDKEEFIRKNTRLKAIFRHMNPDTSEGKTLGGGFRRIAKCRQGLAALDQYEGGKYKRSYHQIEFHDNFIRACARIFWKTEKPGTFARDHQKILELNGWENLSQVSLNLNHIINLITHTGGAHYNTSKVRKDLLG